MIKNTYDGSYFLTGEEMREALETLGEAPFVDKFDAGHTLETLGESRTLESELGADPVERPAHYTRFGGPEPIEIAEHLSFCLGSVLKYIARAGHKDDAIQDLKKARFYLNREIARLERAE